MKKTLRITIAVLTAVLFCTGVCFNVSAPNAFAENASASELPPEYGLENQWYAGEDFLNYNITKNIIDATFSSREYYEENPIIIAVIDTGIELEHPAFEGLLYKNAAELDGNKGVDDDKNGKTDDVCGWDFVNKDATPQDDCYKDELKRHGTHVSGIIAQLIRGYGLEKYIKILPVKAGNKVGEFHHDDAADAIDYARDMGADIINLSFGCVQMPGWNENSNVHTAVINAKNKGAIIFAAAGNSGYYSNNYEWNTYKPKQKVKALFYPAAFDEVYGVMAHDNSLKLRGTSNYGPAYDLVAPGENIYSALYNDGVKESYGLKSGTSMATPFVSFMAAALLLQRGGNVDCVREILDKSDGLNIKGKNGSELYKVANFSNMLTYQSEVFDVRISVEGNRAQVITNAENVVFTAHIFDLRGNESEDDEVYDSVKWTVSFNDGTDEKTVKTDTGKQTAFIPDKVGEYTVSYVVDGYNIRSGTEKVSVEYAEVDDVTFDIKPPSETVKSGGEYNIFLDGYQYIDADEIDLRWYVNGKMIPADNSGAMSFAPQKSGTYTIECRGDDGKVYAHSEIKVKLNSDEAGRITGYTAFAAICAAVLTIFAVLIAKRIKSA